MFRLLLAPIAFLVASNSADAANWVAIPNQNGTAYVDMAGVRRATFPKMNIGGVTNLIGGHLPTATYTVAWLATADDAKTFSVKIEVVFDCRGKMGALQQIVLNETKDSLLHSFDQTQVFLEAGVSFRSIAPDSLYDGAEAMVCPLEKR